MSHETKEALEEFGEKVVSEVFDRSCEFLQATITNGMCGNKIDPLHLAYQSLDEESAKVVRQFMYQAVDQTFAQFLNFFDSNDIPIQFNTTKHHVIDVTRASDGLASEPYNDWGWIAKFSKFKSGIKVDNS